MKSRTRIVMGLRHKGHVDSVSPQSLHVFHQKETIISHACHAIRGSRYPKNERTEAKEGGGAYQVTTFKCHVLWTRQANRTNLHDNLAPNLYIKAQSSQCA